MFKMIRSGEYSCMSTDVKVTELNNDPIDDDSTLEEVNADTGVVTAYLFVQGDWREVGEL